MAPSLFYFSSTGNSLYVAKRLSERFGGGIRYIPSVEEAGLSGDPVFVISPVYAFGLPEPTKNFLSQISPESPLYLILTYGGAPLGADRRALKYGRELGLQLLRVFKVRAPENFTIVFKVPNGMMSGAVKGFPKRTDKLLDKIAKALEQDKEKGPLQSADRKESKENGKERKGADFALMSRKFSASEACVRCGQCVRNCPAGNITLEEDGIRFHDKCVGCLSCFHRCPKQAILYKGRSDIRHYICPLVDEFEIGK